MQVQWTLNADNDRTNAIDYIAQNNLKAVHIINKYAAMDHLPALVKYARHLILFQ